jgi:hypothetical protein
LNEPRHQQLLLIGKVVFSAVVLELSDRNEQSVFVGRQVGFKPFRWLKG